MKSRIIIMSIMVVQCCSLLLQHPVKHQNSHHKLPMHPDQSSVDSEQARKVFSLLTHGHGTLVMDDFRHFLNISDANHDGKVTSDEFLQEWFKSNVGTMVHAVRFFHNLDSNKDTALTSHDLTIIFDNFDRNDDGQIDVGEFVVQWVKMSAV